MTKEEFWAVFDKGIERKNTSCLKWDGMEKIYGKADLIPLWVADMDFPSPAEVTQALVARAKHGVYGYPAVDPAVKEAVCDWMRERHGLAIAPERIISSPGVVDSLSFVLNAFTQPGDLVAIQPPVYGPFERSVHQTGRTLFKNPLVQTDAGWQMDLDGLEEGLRQGVKMLILCSPHNPVGRVWTREELEAVCALCGRYGARILSDEIHADFELPGHHHTPLLCLQEDAICLVSATKTFNLAGLRNSSMLFGSTNDKETMEAYLRTTGIGEENIFGTLAQTAAYRYGAPWLDALLDYLDETRKAVEESVRRLMPRCSVSTLEGTYLMWLDMREYGLSPAQLEELFVQKAGVALSNGANFCSEGSGFMRVNIATPRKNVLLALERMAEALATL